VPADKILLAFTANPWYDYTVTLRGRLLRLASNKPDSAVAFALGRGAGGGLQKNCSFLKKVLDKRCFI